MRREFLLFIGLLFIGLLFCQNVFSQTTQFTYQGSLQNGGTAANGNYDFEFALFDSLAGGSQIGSTISSNSVAVANGVFSVSLNFGAAFPGANRFLEIRVRPTGGGALTILAPRQAVTSAPYSVKSLNSDNATTANNALLLGGVAANQYVLTGDARLSDARNPLPGNSNYIQNRTTVQSASNFNISGVGNAGVFNATTQFNLNGNRILGVGGTANTFGGINAGANAGNLADSNTFFGNSAGQNMVAAGGNSFFGTEAGLNTTSGSNSFFGAQTGKANTSGQNNSFFGQAAGTTNTTGDENSFFGRSAGFNNQTGNSNSFFGFQAGLSSITSNNSFFGYRAGRFTTTGTNNTFVGLSTGGTNTTGSNNTTLGANANVGSADLSFATAIGAGAVVSSNNRIELGRTQDSVRVSGNLVVNEISWGNVGGSLQINSTSTQFQGSTSALDGRFLEFLDVNLVGGGGANAVCYINTGFPQLKRLAFCGSSIRYKKNIENSTLGLDLIRRLRPVTFDWKNDNVRDLGLIAEEVAEVEPLLVTHNNNGEIEGVKYDRVGIVLINAVNEQQTQIEAQQKQIDEQKQLNLNLQRQVDEQNATIKSQQENLIKQTGELEKQKSELEALKKLVCSQNPTAEICQPQN